MQSWPFALNISCQHVWIQHVLSFFHFRSGSSSLSPIMFSLWFLLLKWLWRYDLRFFSLYQKFIPQNSLTDMIWLLLKVVALGFCAGKHSYLQSTWNVLDGVLVFVSLVDILVSLAYTNGNRILGILRVLRLLRTLRPLRWARAKGHNTPVWGSSNRWNPLHGHCSS